MPTATRLPTATSRSVHNAGLWCLIAGLIGASQAIVLLAWPPQVPDDRYSYPFTSAGFITAQASFFFQHLPLIIAVASMAQLPAVRVSRTARIGMVAAAIGLVVLTLNELVTMVAYDSAADSEIATTVNNLYGPPVILIGAGLVAAGVALLHRGSDAWAGAPWIPTVILSLGVYVFVVLTPAITGSFTAGRLGIGGWMLLFALLGFSLTRLPDGQRKDG